MGAYAKDISEPCLWIDAAQLGGFNQCEGDCQCFRWGSPDALDLVTIGHAEQL